MTNNSLFCRVERLERRCAKAKALLEYFGKRDVYRQSILRAVEASAAVFVVYVETEGDVELVNEALDLALRNVCVVESLAGFVWQMKLVPGVN